MESEGRCAAGRWPGYPVREAVRLPPLVPAAECDRPGELAAVFCRAGLARSAAAWPGRAGPPRPAGVPAAVIPPPVPPPGSLGAPPTTLPLAAPRTLSLQIPAQSHDPAGTGKRHRREGLGYLGGPPPSLDEISQVKRRNAISSAGGDRMIEIITVLTTSYSRLRQLLSLFLIQM